jgi:hypothetical protein
MKARLFIFSSVFFVFACGNGEAESVDSVEQEQEETVELGENYGPVEVDITQAISVEEMISDFEGKSGRQEYTFEGTLTEVCSKAGCWVNIDKGDGETFMVRFKDHFTIPTETEPGTEAFLHGELYRDTVTVDLLRHFAEDAGKSEEEINAITEPKFELGFEADGIVLKK